jgi:rod shape-determining protein MreD
MRNNPISIGISLILIIILQVLVVDHFLIFGYVIPLVYLYGVLYLPTVIKPIPTLIIAFLLGWTIDLFQGTGGIHASACVLLAYVKPFLLRSISTQGGLEYERLSIQNLGMPKFLIYSSLGVLTATLWIHVWETFAWSLIFSSILKAIISSLFTVILITLLEMLLYSRKEK